jgi:uncharacterized protein YoxC
MISPKTLTRFSLRDTSKIQTARKTTSGTIIKLNGMCKDIHDTCNKVKKISDDINTKILEWKKKFNIPDD